MSATPRCGRCREPVRWLRQGSAWRAFDATPVVGDDRYDLEAYPVLKLTAWPTEQLIAHVAGLQQLGPDAAEGVVHSLPWHTRHRCRPTTNDVDEESTR